VIGQGISNTKWWRSPEIAWLAAILLLSLGVRLFHIESKPLWLDEVFTFKRIHLGLADMIADSFANRHMPSYFLLLHLFSELGDGATIMRLPSALFGALSAVTVYGIARAAGGRGAGLVAGMLMALSPQQVQYGQEARSYTLEVLLITVALWGVVRIAQNPAAAGFDLRDRRSERWGWAAYLLGTFSALDVLGDAAPWLIASNLSLYLIWRHLPVIEAGATAPRRVFLRTWLLSQGLVLACCLPFYGLIVAANGAGMLHNFDWIPRLSWQHLWVSASSVYLMRMAAVVRFDLVPTAAPILAPIVALLGALGVHQMRSKLEGKILFLGFAVLPLMFLLVSLVKPMLLPRYILWSAAPFFVLAGLGATALPRRGVPVLITALLALGAINLAPVYQAETKPRWDLAAATLASQVRPGDTVFTGDEYAPEMLKILQPRDGMPIETTALVTPRLDLALARWKQGGRVWAVKGRSGLGENEELDAFESRIAVLGSPSVQIAQGEEITILLYPAPVVQ